MRISYRICSFMAHQGLVNVTVAVWTSESLKMSVVMCLIRQDFNNISLC